MTRFLPGIVAPRQAIAMRYQRSRADARLRNVELGRQLRQRFAEPLPPAFAEAVAPDERRRLSSYLDFVRASVNDESRLLHPTWSKHGELPPNRLVRPIVDGQTLRLLNPRSPAVSGPQMPRALGRGEFAADEVPYQGIGIDVVTAQDMEIEAAADEARREYRQGRNARRTFVEERGRDSLSRVYGMRQRDFAAALTSSGSGSSLPSAPARGARQFAADTAVGLAERYALEACGAFLSKVAPGAQQMAFASYQEILRTLSAMGARWLTDVVGWLQLNSGSIGWFLLFSELGFDYLAVPMLQWFYGDAEDRATYKSQAASMMRRVLWSWNIEGEVAEDFIARQDGNLTYAADRFYEIVDDAIGAECDFAGAVCYAFTAGQLDACPNCIDVSFDLARAHVSTPLTAFVEDEVAGLVLEGSIGGVGRAAARGFVPPPIHFEPPAVAAPSGGGSGLVPLLLGGGALVAALGR